MCQNLNCVASVRCIFPSIYVLFLAKETTVGFQTEECWSQCLFSWILLRQLLTVAKVFEQFSRHRPVWIWEIRFGRLKIRRVTASNFFYFKVKFWLFWITSRIFFSGHFDLLKRTLGSFPQFFRSLCQLVGAAAPQWWQPGSDERLRAFAGQFQLPIPGPGGASIGENGGWNFWGRIFGEGFLEGEIFKIFGEG